VIYIFYDKKGFDDMKFTVNIYDSDERKDFIFDHEENLATPYEGYVTDLDGLKHLLAHKELRVFDATTNKLITEKGLTEYLNEASINSTQLAFKGTVKEELSAGDIGEDPVTIVNGEDETEYMPSDGDILVDSGDNVMLCINGKFYKIN
jgi:hypothetical protein